MTPADLRAWRAQMGITQENNQPTRLDGHLEKIMTTIDQAKKIIADEYSKEQLDKGTAYAEDIGYEDAEEFFSIAMAKILYSESDLKDGARYPVQEGSLEEYFK